MTSKKLHSQEQKTTSSTSGREGDKKMPLGTDAKASSSCSSSASSSSSSSQAQPNAAGDAAGDAASGGNLACPSPQPGGSVSAVLIDSLNTGNVQEDIKALTKLLDSLVFSHGNGSGRGSAPSLNTAVAGLERGGSASSASAKSSPAAPGPTPGGTPQAELIQTLEWHLSPPFPPPPALMLGGLSRIMVALPPLPFKPPKPSATRPPSFKK
jgi:hypothetical protein